MITNTFKKILLFILSFVCFAAFASEDMCSDARLNGMVFKGLKVGFYKNRTDFKIPEYKDSTIFFDVQCQFKEDRFIWVDSIFNEHEIPTTYLSALLTKTKDKTELKAWENVTKHATESEKRSLDRLPREINGQLRFPVLCDSYFSFDHFKLKYRVEKKRLLIDLKLINDSTIGLCNSNGQIVQTVKHHNGLLSYYHSGQFVYWFEGKRIYLGVKNMFISSPYKMSDDGKTISLILEMGKLPTKPKLNNRQRIALQNKSDFLKVKNINNHDLKVVDSLLVAFGGKAKQYIIDEDTIYINLKDIKKKNKEKWIGGNFSLYTTYNDSLVIASLFEINKRDTQKVISEKFKDLNSNRPHLYVDFSDTAEVMSCIKKHMDLFPKDAVPYFIDNEFILVKKDGHQSKVNQTQITDLYIEGEEFQPHFVINLNEEGAQEFAELTKSNIGRHLAMFIDDKLICNPVVYSVIDEGKLVIAGVFNLTDILEYAIKIKIAS